MADFSIIPGKPVISILQFYGHYQMEKGWTNHADTTIEWNWINNVVDYIQIFGEGMSYHYFHLKSFVITRLKAYNDDDTLYIEWITFDQIKHQ